MRLGGGHCEVLGGGRCEVLDGGHCEVLGGGHCEVLGGGHCEGTSFIVPTHCYDSVEVFPQPDASYFA